MKKTLAAAFCLITASSFASSDNDVKAVEQQTKIASPLAPQPSPPIETCESFKVFKDSVDYLKNQKDLPFSEPIILKAALEISKGCNGADKRFKRIFELLLKSGVHIKKSYELAIDFAHMSEEKADNFAIFFKGLFLENKFDLDFMTAYKISLDLSSGLTRDWGKVQKDFRQFLNFCTSSKSDEIPMPLCAQWTMSMLKHEPLYKDGVYTPFSLLNEYLLQRSGPQVPVKDRLYLVAEIISYGPRAPVNFKRALEWLGSKKGAGLPSEKAHRLALEVAKNSLKNPEPVIEVEKTEKP